MREELVGARTGRADAIEVDKGLDGQGAALLGLRRIGERLSPSSARARAEAGLGCRSLRSSSISAGSSSSVRPAVVVACPPVVAQVATTNGKVSHRTAVDLVI
jgi:hypothetical protein